jgi:hypothetical protein
MGKPAASRARRAPTTPPPADEDTPPAAALTLSRPDDDEDDELARTLALFEGTGGHSVYLERRKDRGVDGGYLGTMQLARTLLEDVKEQYGGGTYRARVVDASGAYVKSITFSIAGRPKIPAEDRAPVEATPAPASMTRLETLLVRLVEKLDAPTPPPAPFDPVAQFAAMANAMKAVMPSTTPPDMLGTMKELLQFSRELDGGRGGDAGDFAGAVRDVGVPLVNAIGEQVKLNREESMRRRTPPVATIPAAVSSDPFAALAQRIPAMARGYFAGCARNDEDPQEAAAMAAAQLSGDVRAELLALIAHDDAAERLCAVVPAWTPYPGWFRGFLEALAAELTGAGDETAAGDVAGVEA